MSATEILDSGFTMIRRNPGVLLGMSAIVAAVQTVITSAAAVLSARGLGNIPVTSAGDAARQSSLGQAVGSSATGIGLLTGTLLGGLLAGLLTIAITQDVLGTRLTLGQVWQRGRRSLARLALLTVVAAIGEVAGLFLLVVPGLWLWAAWAVAIPAMIVEDASVRGSLSRSWQLTAKALVRVWLIRATGYLVTLVLTLVIAIPLDLLAALPSSSLFHDQSGGSAGRSLFYLLLTGLASVLAATLAAPIRASIDTFLYLDQRMRREGLDISMRLGDDHVAERT